MPSKNWQAYIAFVCVILGFLLVVQFRTQEYIGKITLPTRRLEDLTDMLRKTESERDLLEKEVVALRQQLARVVEGEHMLGTVRQELEKVKMAAGLTELKGPGVVVVLNDSRKQAQPGESPELFLVHDEDLLKTANELFAAGADAVAINGQRLVATSEVRCAGPTISVNNTRIGPPYTIVAIGDPVTLENALRMREGIIDTLRAWGIEVKITRMPEVIVPAYKGSIYFHYAKSVDKGGN
ncbi:MAG TPA: DUF881 domain-containing protein [Firmicutes bacterium]|nr:DUF881 domain-containing protein [Bacillota bacterium]